MMVNLKLFIRTLFRVGVLAISTSFLSTLFAQEPGAHLPEPPTDSIGASTPKFNLDKEVARLTKRYGLSASQQSQVRIIMSDHKDKVSSVLQDHSVAVKDRDSHLEDLHAELVSRVSAALTPDQRAKYEKDEKRLRERDDLPDAPDGPPPFGGEGGPPPPGL